MSVTGRRQSPRPGLWVLALCLPCVAPAWGGADCGQLQRSAERRETPFYPRLSYRVTGSGRLYLHRAPDARCRLKDVFVVPGDNLIAYAQVPGWYSVMYVNPVMGEDFQGWVRGGRLKYAGTLGPR